jgi:putative zinc finger/helix-turn-helix YgiT family protein
MTPEIESSYKPSVSPGKPFPWLSPECGRREVHAVSISYATEIKHDGRLHRLEIPDLVVPRCGACGELVFDNRADQRVAQEFRRVLGLLSAAQIRTNREKLGQSQEQLAEHLGVAAETIIRWETGALTPSPAMDPYLRVYFGSAVPGETLRMLDLRPQNSRRSDMPLTSAIKVFYTGRMPERGGSRFRARRFR